MKRMLPLLALCALALPASAAWTYVDNDGSGTYSGTVKHYSSNDKPYHGYITDGNCSIWVYQHDTAGHKWTIGAGGFGVDGGNGGSVRAGTAGGSVQGDSSSLYSGDINLKDANDAIVAATGQSDAAFTVIGRRCFRGYNVNFSIVGVPPTIELINEYAFYQIGNGNKGLKNLDMRGSALTEIGYKAFESQGSTANNQEFWFPETLTTIGGQALAYGPNKRTIHFLGDVPVLGDATALYAGSASKQWAYCVNALQYPSWNGKKTGEFDTGHKSWIPENVRYKNETDAYAVDETTGAVTYPKPFGITAFGTTASETYLIQEGFAGENVPASSIVTATAVGRDSVTFAVTVNLGTSTQGSLSFVFNGQTRTENVTASDTTYTYTFTGLELETAYPYVSTVAAASGDGETTGSVTTVGPDVKLGATDYTISDDGLSATVSVVVSSLLSGTADVVLAAGGATLGSTTVSAAGTVSFDLDSLVLGRTYDCTFTATSSEHGDVATATVSFTAQGYHWEYTPNGGETQAYPWDGATPPAAGSTVNFNGQPYHGTLTDGRWVFCVYHDPAWPAGEFWLGEGGSGSTAYSQKGLPDIDLSGVYADTGVKLVGIGGYAFSGKAGDIHSIVFPKFITHIGKQAFFNCSNLKEIDLGGTSLTNILEMGLQNCTAATNIVLPRTLQKLGGTALAWGPASRVIHFRGGVPTCEPSNSSGVKGADQALYSGANNRQWAYCVDAETYPEWRTHATTTLYDSFPSGEQNWIPESVRYGTAADYEAPFGNSTLGRGYDTSNSGRAYLIQESAPAEDLGFTILIY